MTSNYIDQLLAAARLQRLEKLAARLLSGVDRSPESIAKLRWELEEELNENIYVSLDLLGWNRELLVSDFTEIGEDLDSLLKKFEELEEYEACAQARDLQRWLEERFKFFLAEIDGGEEPTNLIGL